MVIFLILSQGHSPPKNILIGLWLWKSSPRLVRSEPGCICFASPIPIFNWMSIKCHFSYFTLYRIGDTVRFLSSLWSRTYQTVHTDWVYHKYLWWKRHIFENIYLEFWLISFFKIYKNLPELPPLAELPEFLSHRRQYLSIQTLNFAEWQWRLANSFPIQDVTCTQEQFKPISKLGSLKNSKIQGLFSYVRERQHKTNKLKSGVPWTQNIEIFCWYILNCNE